jgi:carbonic anhydrase
MSMQHEAGRSHNHPDRRRFLKASGAITAITIIGTGTISSIAYADALTKGAARQAESRRHFSANEEGQ